MNDQLENLLLNDVDEIFFNFAVKALEKDIAHGYIVFSQKTWDTFRQRLKGRIQARALQTRPALVV